MNAVDPVAFFKKFHWATLPTSNQFKNSKQEMNAELIAALEKGYRNIFTTGEVPPGQVRISDLECCPSPDRVNTLTGLSPEHAKLVNGWAQSVLETAQKSTDEELYIARVTVGYGFSANRGEGPLIHVDANTYLHGLTTLRGPSSIVYPNGKELRYLSITGENPNNGEFTVSRAGDADAKPIVTRSGIQIGEGETILISGTDFEKENPGAKGTWHSSPTGVKEDRVSLFVTIARKKK